MTSMPFGLTDFATDQFQTRQVPAPEAARRPDAHPSATLGDIAVLLSAVQERLRHVTRDNSHGRASGPTASAADDGQRAVQECAQALEQLHALFMDEVSRHDALKLEMFDAHTALAQTQAELRGTQAGERQARHRALHDGLTALPNRSFFMEELALALRSTRTRGLAVMYLDLDEFKRINDQHGHAVGDEMLRIVAARLARVMRSQDVVSRLGGDEFACLLKGLLDRERLQRLAAEMHEAVSAPCRIGPLTLSVRPSIGIASCPCDGSGVDELLNNADAAMYRAKREGCGHAFFSG
jgi:diguanylate cyclase (GGDEF)-like protein